LEHYVRDLKARGKKPNVVGRAITTAKAIETTVPALLDLSVTRLVRAA
jgi:hypothetical protein